MLKLLTEVGGPESWSGMVGFSGVSRTKLKRFRACHIYTQYTSVFTRANNANPTWTYMTQCRMGIIPYGLGSNLKTENCVLIANEGHYDTY